MQCLRQGVVLESTEKRVEAFEKLKSALRMLQFWGYHKMIPHANGSWIVMWPEQSSNSGKMGKLRIIEYASRVFNRAERNYCATCRELTAVIFALKVF